MNENTYKRIAEEYLREYGSQLRRELDGLEAHGSLPDTLSLDRRVRLGIASRKRVTYLRYAGLVAACLVFAVLTPLILRFSLGNVTDPTDSTSPTSPTSPGYISDSAAPDMIPAEGYEILPLAFSLPGQFSVASVDQDNEKTVYHLTDSKLDDVVLTLEHSGDVSRYDALTEVTIGGRSAFADSGNGYSLLAFTDEESDVLFVLTCKYDVNTLVLLGESILV